MRLQGRQSAWSSVVCAGMRKIHGMLVEVSVLSVASASTGTNDFSPSCSAKWLELRSRAMIPRTCCE